MSRNDVLAMQVGRLVLEFVEVIGLRAPVAATVYTNVTDHSAPPDCVSLDAFNRLHRTKMREGVDGWTKQGTVRAVSVEAWRQHVSEQTTAAAKRAKRKPPVAAPTPTPMTTDAVDPIDAKLGIRLRVVR